MKDHTLAWLLAWLLDGKVIQAFYIANARQLPNCAGLLVCRLRTEAALSAPTKKLSEKKSQKKKKAEKAAALAAAAAAAESGEGNTTAATPPPAAAAAASALGAAKGPGHCFEDPLPDVTGAGKDQKQKQQQEKQEDVKQTPAGVRFVSLGLSPFHQLKDGEMKHSKAFARLLNITYERGNTFYPYKAIALSKAKYGAGLHDGIYEDPNVTYRMTYLCHSHSKVASLTMFDLGVFVGFWSNPPDAVLTMVKSKITEVRMRRLKQRAAKKQQQQLDVSQRLSTCSTAPSALQSACSTAPSLLTQASEKTELDESDRASSSSGTSSQEPVKIRLVMPKSKGMELTEIGAQPEAEPKGSKGKSDTGAKMPKEPECLRAVVAA